MKCVASLLFALAMPLAANAQQGKPARIGALVQISKPVSLENHRFGGLVRGLRELGYVEGKNLVIEWRFANSVPEQLPVLAAELVQQKVDVIVTFGSPATAAAQKATTTIPIVMGTVADPVASGFVKSLAKPGGNITGLSNLTPDLTAKHLEMLRALVPKLSRVGILVNPVNPTHDSIARILRKEAEREQITVLVASARAPNELAAAIGQLAAAKCEAFVIANDSTFNQEVRRIAELAKQQRLPSIAALREYPEAGGVISYGQNLADSFRRSAAFVDRILKGAKPGDLPVEQSTTFETVVNLGVAKAIGLRIPQAVLVRADLVIQ